MTISIKTFDEPVQYDEAHKLQLETVEKRKSKEIKDTLFLLEHPPVITLGKSADANGVVASNTMLQNLGVSVHNIERGGEATYHCPGQLIGYPIVDLHQLKIGVAKYVYLLEQVMIDSFLKMGLECFRIEGKTGVFANTKNSSGVFAKNETSPKVGALGVRVSRGITYHGFSMNIEPDLTGFNLIIPCGLPDTPVSSLAQLHKSPGMPKAKEIVTSTFLKLFS